VVIITYQGSDPTISGLTFTKSSNGALTVLEFTSGTGTISW
jgi:hypothetical protein